LAGGLLMAATAIMFTGAAIGFFAPSLREAPWTDDPQQAAIAIAGNPNAYAWANGLILAAVLLTALALVPVTIQFKRSSRPWAWTALVAFALAAVFETIDRTIGVQVFTWAAQQHLSVTDPVVQAFIRFQDGLGYAFYILGFLALGLYGMAMLLQRTGASGLGWLFVAGGVLGIVLQVAGAAIPAMVFIGTAALGAATWLLDAVPEQ
jgi:hypothetical protein